MNGNRYILDTNAIISLLKGNPEVLKLIEKADWIGISIISYIEFLAFPGLLEQDRKLFLSFIQRVDIVDIEKSNQKLLDAIVHNRMKYGIKLPDSIIISTAAVNEAKLITADKQIISISETEIISFNP